MNHFLFSFSLLSGASAGGMVIIIVSNYLVQAPGEREKVGLLVGTTRTRIAAAAGATSKEAKCSNSNKTWDLNLDNPVCSAPTCLGSALSI